MEVAWEGERGEWVEVASRGGRGGSWDGVALAIEWDRWLHLQLHRVRAPGLIFSSCRTTWYVGKCPSSASSTKQPPVCEVDFYDPSKSKWDHDTSYNGHNDFAQMRSLGFNLIRLAVSWSLLEPSPSTYSEDYVKRIEQLISWANKQNIWVIIDMHQDFWGPGVGGGGGDGAAAWASLGGDVKVPWWINRIIWPAINGKLSGFSKDVLLNFDALYKNTKV